MSNKHFCLFYHFFIDKLYKKIVCKKVASTAASPAKSAAFAFWAVGRSLGCPLPPWCILRPCTASMASLLLEAGPPPGRFWFCVCCGFGFDLICVWFLRRVPRLATQPRRPCLASARIGSCCCCHRFAVLGGLLGNWPGLYRRAHFPLALFDTKQWRPRAWLACPPRFADSYTKTADLSLWPPPFSTFVGQFFPPPSFSLCSPFHFLPLLFI
jgi:hypothetical protein